MTKKLKDEYHHFGTNKIYAELWQDIYMDSIKNPDYTKPLGGFWTSEFNQNYISEWLWYIEKKYNYDFDLYIGRRKSVLVKFKEDTRFLNIETPEDYKNLKDSGFIIPLDIPIKVRGEYDYTIITEIPDYEKIAEHYDLMFVNNFVHDCFKQYSIFTMLALNIDSIEYYKPIEADYINKNIHSIGEKQYISKPIKSYYDFLKHVKTLFENINANSYEEFVKKITKLKNTIIEDLIKNFDSLKLDLPKDLNIEHLVYSTVQNTANKKIKELKNLHK